MKSSHLIAKLVILSSLVVSAAQAATILFVGGDFLTAADPTQQGRLSRNGIPQDWANDEPFPGVINTTTTYHYREYQITDLSLGNFIQIEFDTVPTNTFVAAYDTSYDPTNEAATWLGDAGTSGNSFGTNPLAFQVIVPFGHTLDIVVNTTPSPDAAGLGPANAYNLTVEAFVDSEFTDAAPAPEPASALLVGIGMLAALACARKRQQSRLN